jgi:hypothetical protein
MQLGSLRLGFAGRRDLLEPPEAMARVLDVRLEALEGCIGTLAPRLNSGGSNALKTAGAKQRSLPVTETP